MQNTLPNFYKSPHKIARGDEKVPVLLALSGGADSSSLLNLLCRERKMASFELYAAHVNHGIRTEEYSNEAKRDEDFCRRICEAAGVELFVKQIDVPALAKASGRSLETEAREARYAFFAEIMNEKGIKILVTAHNASDNLETQIFNLCRGCGISGVSGIPESRSFDAVEGGIIVRPVLTASRSEILEYCRENKIEFVIDSTNLEEDCTRNIIRSRVIPKLRARFGTPEKNSLRLSVSAREDDEFITEIAQDFISEQGEHINVSALLSRHPSVSKRALRIAFERVSDANLEAVHVNDLLSFAETGRNGSLSLPDGVSAIFQGGNLSFQKEILKITAVDYDQVLIVGVNPIGNTNFAVAVAKIKAPQANVTVCGEEYNLYATAALCLDDTSSLSAANRREGDLITDNGMHKKLKKLMCDKKIPLCDRDCLPIIKKSGEIIYAPLCAVADAARSDKPNYTISIYKKTNSEEYHVKRR